MKNRKLKSSFLLMSLLLLVPQELSAQNLKDFQEAMKIPREPGRGYVMTKRFKDEKLRRVASENRFKIVGMNYKGYAMFVPLDELDAYTFEINGIDNLHYFTQGYARAMDLNAIIDHRIKSGLEHYIAIGESERVNKNLKGTDFKNRGSFYFYENEIFVKYDNAFWTGEVNNGMIDGRGDGFVVIKNKDGQNEYRSFSGGFKNGIPNGPVVFALGIPQNGTLFNSYLKTHKETVEVGNICEGLAKYKIVRKRGPYYGYIDAQGKIIINPNYKDAKDFSNGIAYVTPDKTEVKIDKTGRVVAVSENARLSFDEMVKMKNQYPHLAPSIETNASKYVEGKLSYNELVQVEKEFPSLAQKIAPRKLAIYRDDCKQLEDIYLEAQASANEKKANKKGESFVNTFLNQYAYNTTFDPDNKKPIAIELDDYYMVCKAMEISIRDRYWESTKEEPIFFSYGNDHKKWLYSAKEICGRSSNSKFKSFYAYAAPDVKSKYDVISNKLERDTRAYNAAYATYQAKQKKKQALLKEIDDTSVFRYVEDDSQEWSGGRVIDSNTNYDDHKTVVFKEIDDKYSYFSVTVHKVRHGDDIHYYSAGGSFDSYNDMICGAYLNHYNMKWEGNKRR